MLLFILRRIVSFVPMLVLLAFLTFVLSFYGPGDPLRIMMGENWSNEDVYHQLRHQYGLDRPLITQFGDYAWNALHGDFGRSYIQKVQVSELIWNAIPISAQLALVALVLIAVLGIGLGIVSALFRNRWPDVTIGTVGVIFHSIPTFVLAPIVLVLLVSKLGIINTPTGWHGIFSYQTFIAASVLAAYPMLSVIRQTRASVGDILSQDYIRTARAKGVTEWGVMIRHVLRNAMAPVVTSLGLTFGVMLGGAIFVESAFAIPGMGQLLFSALRNNDYPLLTGATIVSGFWIMVSSVIVDIIYGLLDPRIRSQR
jgi:ABC-type dipeptide/oligopeptide/nickel transport system permease component